MMIELDSVETLTAFTFAYEVCASYGQGLKEKSKKLAVKGKPEIHSNACAQAVGRLGEMACCKALGLDYSTSLNWLNVCDYGFDFKLGKWSIDVKSTAHPRATRLIWPQSKTSFMDKCADLLMFCKVNLLLHANHTFNNPNCRSEVDIVGYISRDKFIRNCTYAKDEQGIVDGTPYVLAKDLKPIEDIISYLLWLKDINNEVMH